MRGSKPYQYQNAPKKRVGAGALLLNERDEFLIIKASYKEYCSLPGGVVDKNESPREACVREVKEEVGIEITSAIFLCLDYARMEGGKDESLEFIFYGGRLNANQIAHIKIDESEITAYQFINMKEVSSFLGGSKRPLVKRLSRSIEALENNIAVYIESSKW